MIYALSDLHVDYPANKAWLAAELPKLSQSIARVPSPTTITSPTPLFEDYNDFYFSCSGGSGGYSSTIERGYSARVGRGDTLLVAGDITHDIILLENTLTWLTHVFEHVFYVPGNHELWITREDKRRGLRNSIEKFNEIRKLCTSIGVHTTPARVDNVYIVPLFSWYDLPGSEHSLFEPDHLLDSSEDMWSDTHSCIWPEELTKHKRCKFFTDLNLENLHLAQSSYPIITMSHFFSNKVQYKAHSETCLQRYLMRTGKTKWSSNLFTAQSIPRPNFSVCAGSTQLDPIIKALKPCVHIFGHSHRELKVEIDGTMYINAPLGYPQERNSGALTLASPPFFPLSTWITTQNNKRT